MNSSYVNKMNVKVTIITPSTLGEVKDALALLVNSSYVKKMNVEETIITPSTLGEVKDA